MEVEEIKEIREIKELYKMNAEKLKSILEKKKITERIVNLFEKSQYLKKEDLEKMLKYEIPALKEDLLFLLYLVDFQEKCVEKILDIMNKL
jgi:predicted metal-binding protein